MILPLHRESNTRFQRTILSSRAEGCPKSIAYGLRNPWRFSFEPVTNRLFVADVGQDSWEEIDILQKGGNFGWNVMEGTHCYPPGTATAT